MLRLLLPLAILAGAATLVWAVFFGRADPAVAPATPTPPQAVSRDTDWYPERRWDDRPPGDLNISVFVYRDRNRNGVYDTADLPMAAVAVLLERPDGSLRMERSNINGYANFKVSAGNPGIDIGRPDVDYHFEVQPPPGWSISSGNARQSMRFELLTGAPTGMFTPTPPVVVGLVPTASVSSSVRLDAAQATELIAIGPDGPSQPLALDADGAFSFQAQPGAWTLAARRDGQIAPLRRFEMADAPVALAAIDAGASLPPAKPTTVTVDFEGFDRSIIEKLAHGYRGLDWDYLLAIDNQHYRGPGYVNTLASGRAVGYNSSGYPVTVRGLRPGERFDFEGAYFGVAWPQAEGEMLNLEGWRDGHRVYADRIRLSHLGPVWFQADYRDIEQLRLRTDHYWQFTTDDMRFGLATEPEHR